jgi:putative two-component system response regulator
MIVPDEASQKIILAVDDTTENLQLLGRILRSDYKVKGATNGEKAITIAKSTPQPDLILLDVMMPGIDGFETCKRLKTDPKTHNIPVIFLTALSESENESKGLELGAVDYIIKPFNPSLVKARVRNHIELKRYQDHLNELVDEKTRELALTQNVTILAMASIAESRDPETGEHIQRTKKYIKILAQQLKNNPLYSELLTNEYIDLIFKSAPLHDIGKVAIKDSILLKQGELTEKEFNDMKLHTQYGYDAIHRSSEMLGKSSFLNIAQSIAISHHEKWDGSGYPYGISGDNIPLEGRLMAVVDVYDALVSKRSYKSAFEHNKAVDIMLEGKGTHFDPDIIDAFVIVAEQFNAIAQNFSDKKK